MRSFDKFDFDENELITHSKIKRINFGLNSVNDPNHQIGNQIPIEFKEKFGPENTGKSLKTKSTHLTTEMIIEKGPETY